MKNGIKLTDGYWIVFFCFNESWIEKNGTKVVAQYPLQEQTGSDERLQIANDNKVNPIWDFYGMVFIKNGEIREIPQAIGRPCFIGMNKESTAFYRFDIETLSIISYYKI